MQGEVIIDNKKYHYFFNEIKFELIIYGLPGIILNENSAGLNSGIQKGQILEANSFDNKYPYIRFVVRNVLRNHLDKITIRILYYIETSKSIEMFDAMSFFSDELNSFYNITNSFETTGFQKDGQVEIRVKKFDEVGKDYFFECDDDLKNITLNFYRQLNYGETEILTISTEMRLIFKKSQDFQQIYRYYFLIYNLFRFITYRNNIRFRSIKLKVLGREDKYEDLGLLKIFIDSRNFYIEEDKVKKNQQIKAVYIGDKITYLIDLIKSDRLYMDHYPENSVDKQHITPARFLLVTAAFEWECQEIYGDYKYEENKDFKAITDLIYNILEEEKGNYNGKKKKYIKNYQKSFKYVGVSLAEKIKHALTDNDDILSLFIKDLYKLNYIVENEYTYNKIAERISRQRNNYAHGQIDREMENLMILDFIVLELLLYAMRLKYLKFDINTIKRIINELFARGLFLE